MVGEAFLIRGITDRTADESTVQKQSLLELEQLMLMQQQLQPRLLRVWLLQQLQSLVLKPTITTAAVTTVLDQLLLLLEKLLLC